MPEAAEAAGPGARIALVYRMAAGPHVVAAHPLPSPKDLEGQGFALPEVGCNQF